MLCLLGLACALVVQAAEPTAPPPLGTDPGIADAPLVEPGLPPRVNDWVPLDWWTPVDFVTGLLNDDGVDDVALVLERKQDAPENPAYPRGARALMILFGTEHGRWLRGPLVPDMLPCGRCRSTLSGGTAAELYDLSISADGLLEIGWIHRRQGIKSVRLIIGWDPGYRALGLLADDVMLQKPASGGRSRVRRDYRAGMSWVDGEPRSMPPRFIPIEDVSAAQY